MHDPSAIWELLDRALVHLAPAGHEEALRGPLAEFQQRTGEFEPGQAWYEERVRLFHDWVLFERLWEGERVGLAVFLDEAGAGLPGVQRELYAELLRSAHRSVFEVERARGEDRLRLHDRIGGAVFTAAAEPLLAGLATGDLIDARLLLAGDGLILSRGLLVHSRRAHEAIAALVERARADLGGPPWDLPDLLARMKRAFDRAENPRIAALYGPESYLYRDLVRTRRGS